MKLTVLVASLSLLFAQMVSAETIVLKSGNAPIGSIDPLVTVRGAPELGDGKIPNVPLRQARVITDGGNPWVAPIAGTQWLTASRGVGTWASPLGGIYRTGDNDELGGWFVYEIHFSLPDRFVKPFIRVTSTADDWGTIYLNDNWCLGFSHVFDGFSQNETDDPSLFRIGDNKLSFCVNNYDFGKNITNPTGLDFYAEVTYEMAPVPEPSSLLALGGGVVGLIGIRRKQK